MNSGRIRKFLGKGEHTPHTRNGQGQPETEPSDRRLRVFGLMHRAYVALIVEAAVILVVFGLIGYGEYFIPAQPRNAVLLLVGFIAADQILLGLSQGTVISLGFPFILLAVLIEDPFVAWGVATVGSLASDILRNMFLYRRLIPSADRSWRPLLYAGHHSLAAMSAAVCFGLAVMAFPAMLDLNMMHLQALLAYVMAYGLASQILVWPHDWLINKLVFPDQIHLPRIELLSALVVMTPVPLALFYLYFRLPPNAQWVLLVILVPAFFLLYKLMRSYVAIEDQRNRLVVVDLVHQGIQNTDGTMRDLTERLMRMAWLLARCEAVAVYGARENTAAVILRGAQRRDRDKTIYSLDDALTLGEDRPPASPWPAQLATDSEPLAEILAAGEPKYYPDLTGIIDAETKAGRWLARQAGVILPLKAQANVVGLIVIAKPRFVLAEFKRLEMFASETGDVFNTTQQHERQIRHLYSQLAEFIRDREQTQRAIAELIYLNVDLGRILSKISHQSYHTNLRAVLTDIIRGERYHEHLSLPDELLSTIYQEVRGETPGMPPPSQDVLDKIKAIISSLSVAFTIGYQFPDIPRNEESNELYKQCLAALEANTIAAIVTFAEQLPVDFARSGLAQSEQVRKTQELLFKLSKKIGYHLRRSEQLVEAEARLEQLHIANHVLDEFEAVVQPLPDLARFIVINIINTWRSAITTTLRATENGQATLRLAMTAHQALTLETVTLGLRAENVGPASATHVSIALLEGDDYEITQGQVSLGLLAGGQAREVEFSVKPRARDRMRAHFRVDFRDGQRHQAHEELADFVYLQGSPPPFRPIQNPYIAGRPLPPGSDVFVGREDVFAFIKRHTIPHSRDSILLLTGERRMGKTSIAKQLPLHLAPQGYVPAYVDCQSLGVDGGSPGFFLTICDAIVDAIEDVLDVSCPGLDYVQLAEHPQHAFQRRFLPQVRRCIGDRVLLLIIDEFEVLEDRVERGKLERDIFDYLRHLMQHVEGLGFIFTGTHSLQQLATDYWSVLFNIAKHYHIGFLDQEATVTLITQPVQSEGMYYDELAVQRIIRAGGRHPYFTQLLCDYLVGVCNDARRNFVTVQDVRDALEPIVEIGSMHLSYVWLESTPAEKAVLFSLTSLLDREQHTAQAGLIDWVQHLELPISRDQIPAALERLHQRHIIQRGSGPVTYYDFAVDLYRLWIKRNKVLDSVVEEIRQSIDS